MSWFSTLTLHFDTLHNTTVGQPKTRLFYRKHSGALMVQRPFYPEPKDQQGICHLLILYPPAGIAFGDNLTIDIALKPHSHAVMTTPGAGKWYGKASRNHSPPLVQVSPPTEKASKQTCTSDSTEANPSISVERARQHVQAHLAAHTRLEWLPQESIIYNEANMQALNHFVLKNSSSLLTWDISVFGRQAYDEQFLQGHYRNGLQIYREGRIIVTERVTQAAQSRWFSSLLGLAGQHVQGSFWAVPSLADINSHPRLSDASASSFANPESALRHYLDHTITRLRQAIAQKKLPIYCTHNHQAVNMRYIGTDVRACFEAFCQLREVLREHWWQLQPCRPRIWDT